MRKLKKIAIPIENNRFIYVPKSIVDGISKKAIITSQYVADGKLVIEYKNKKGSGHGVMKLNDIGSDKKRKN